MSSKRPVSVKFNPFEHAVLRFFKRQDLQGRRILVAVSGGVDSMALLFCLWRIRKAAQLDLSAAYIHHGVASIRQMAYRDRAQKYVETLCEVLEIPFFSNSGGSKRELKSENELREYRRAQLQKISDQIQAEFIVTAHHQDDLVETQLLRLIRGTGLQGLRGFAPRDGRWIRPFVEFRKSAIQEYAKKFRVPFIQDPSNRSSQPLRNWLRQKWLVPLEKRESGLYSSLARSLLNLSSESVDKGAAIDMEIGDRINTRRFMTLSRDQKESVLARYMRAQDIKNYRSTHIRELLKRLDTCRGELKFSMLRRQWQVNAEHIFCEPPARRDTLLTTNKEA